MEDLNNIPLKRYRSHKVVGAARIRGYDRVPPSNMHDDPRPVPGPQLLVVEDAEGNARRFAPQDGWWLRMHGDVTDKGYFVVYEDGYQSWSPSAAFENGYTEIEGPREIGVAPVRHVPPDDAVVGVIGSMDGPEWPKEGEIEPPLYFREFREVDEKIVRGETLNERERAIYRLKRAARLSLSGMPYL